MVSVEPTTGFVKALVGGRDFNASQVNLALGACPEGYEAPAEGPDLHGRRRHRPPAGLGVQAVHPGQGVRGGHRAQPGLLRPRQATPSPTAPATTAPWATWRAAATAASPCGRPPSTRSTRCSPSSSATSACRRRPRWPTAWASPWCRPTASRPTATPTGSASPWARPRCRPSTWPPPTPCSPPGATSSRPRPIVKVTDAKGQVIEDNTKRTPKRVLSEVVADNVTDALKGVITSGTGTGAAIGRPEGTRGQDGQRRREPRRLVRRLHARPVDVGVDGLQRLQHPVALQHQGRVPGVRRHHPRLHVEGLHGRGPGGRARGRLPQAGPPGGRRHRRRPPGPRRHHPQGRRRRWCWWRRR